jgi:hypothetical protein
MQKKIFNIIIILLFSQLTNSQSFTGFNIGSNFSTLTGDSAKLPTQNFKMGFNIGLTWDIQTVYESYIQLGLLFSQQGSIDKDEYFEYGYKYTHKIYRNVDYIKLPLQWKQKWGDFYTTIGFFGAFTPNPTSKWIKSWEYNNNLISDTGYYASFNNYTRSIDIGGTFSLGFQIPFNKKFDYFISLGLNRGLLAINTNTKNIENKMYNLYFTISTGLITVPNKMYTYKKKRRK